MVDWGWGVKEAQVGTGSGQLALGGPVGAGKAEDSGSRKEPGMGPSESTELGELGTPRSPRSCSTWSSSTWSPPRLASPPHLNPSLRAIRTPGSP